MTRSEQLSGDDRSMLARWRISLLGEFSCVASGENTERLGSRKAALVLVRIALGERSVQRDELADLLWPEEPAEVSRPRLRQALASVNRSLPGESPILAQRNEIGLSDDCAVDVREFGIHLRTRNLTAAFELYRPLLPGWSEDWLRPYRQGLRDQFQDLCLKLAGQYRNDHDTEGATKVLSRGVQLEPLDERLQFEYMAALRDAGLYAQVLRHYEDYAGMLDEQIGLSPSPAVEELVREAKRLGRATPASRTAPLAPHPMPGYLSTFFGRAEPIAELDRLVKQGRRLITITGIGGVGKTRLALEFAREAARAYDTIAFVALIDVTDPELVLPSVHQALGLSTETLGDPLLAIARALSARSCLLIVDNFEHLPAPAPLVLRSLLESAPSVTAIVTSRCRLEIPGEQELPLEPLFVSNGSDVASPAVEMFLDRARLSNPDAGKSEADQEAALRIVADLDGIPLALELAAAQTRLLSIPELEARVKDRVAMLATTRSDFEPRHRQLRDVLAWSLETLSPNARRLFRTLAVFRGSFSIESSEAVWAEANVERLLEELLSRSLIIQTAGAPVTRFRFLAPIRELALEGPDEEMVPARGRMLNYFVTFAGDADYIRTPRSTLAKLLFTEEIDNVREALAYAQITDTGKGLQLAISMARFCNHEGNPLEGRRWLETFLATDPSVNPHIVGHALFVMAAGYGFQGDHERAIQLFQDCLPCASPHHRGFAYLNMAWQYAATARYGLAHDCAVACRERFQGEPPADLRILQQVSAIVTRSAFAPCEEDETRLWALYEEQKAIQSTWPEVMCLFEVALFYVIQGDAPRAVAACERAFAEAERGQHWANYLGHAHYKTEALIQIGDLAAARQWIAECLIRAQEQGSRIQPIYASYYEGVVCAMEGRREEALRYLLEALSEGLDISAHKIVDQSLRRLADLFHAEPGFAGIVLATARALRVREEILLTPHERRVLDGLSASLQDPGRPTAREVPIAELKAALDDPGIRHRLTA